MTQTPLFWQGLLLQALTGVSQNCPVNSLVQAQYTKLLKEIHEPEFLQGLLAQDKIVTELQPLGPKPFPEKPGLQVQVRNVADIIGFASQRAFGEQPPLFTEQMLPSTELQVNPCTRIDLCIRFEYKNYDMFEDLPSPTKPGGQEPHATRSPRLKQDTCGDFEHPPLLTKHRSTVEHEYPSPENPVGHGPQVYPLSVLIQGTGGFREQ